MRRQGFFFQRRWFAAVYITVAIFILLLISFVFYWFHARTMEDLKASQTEVLNNTSTVFQSQLDSFSLAAYQLYAMPASTVLLATQRTLSRLSSIFPNRGSPSWPATT